jgi:HK97 gp10 family phage protein
MATIKVKIEGYDSLLLKLNKIADMDLTKKVNKATTLVHGQAKDLAPVDTGDLAGSIHIETKRLPKAIQGKVYTNLEYAPYVEFGTGKKGDGTYPYNIKGLTLSYKDKGWCYWSDKENKFIFTTGQEAQPYMYPALKNNEKKIRAIMQEGVKDTLRDICKGGK